MMSEPAIERLMWFSRGYYTILEEAGELIFIDLRFGRSDGWLTDEGNFIFRFRLLFDPNNPNRVLGFEQWPPSISITDEIIDRYIARVLGERLDVRP